MKKTWSWLAVIVLLTESLDLAECQFTDYRRKLDFKSGIYSRELIWHLNNGESVKIRFERFVSMTFSQLGCQRIVESFSKKGTDSKKQLDVAQTYVQENFFDKVEVK